MKLWLRLQNVYKSKGFVLKRILPIILFFVGIACVYWSQNNLYKKLGVSPEDFGGLTKKKGENDYEILIKDKKELKLQINHSLKKEKEKEMLSLFVKNTSSQDIKKVNVYLKIKQNKKLVFGKSFSHRMLKKNKQFMRKFVLKNTKNVKGKATFSVLIVSEGFYTKFNKKIDL